MYNMMKIAPNEVQIIGPAPASSSPNLPVDTVTNSNPNNAKIPTEFESIPWNGLAFSPDVLTNLIRATNWPRFLPVLNGRTTTFRIIITKDTINSIVVITLVSPAIMKIAARSTPKFQAKLTNQLIVLSSLLQISKPSGNPEGLAVLGFFCFFGFFSFAGFAIASFTWGSTSSTLATAFATAFALGFATAFALGFASVVLEVPLALSNNPI